MKNYPQIEYFRKIAQTGPKIQIRLIDLAICLRQHIYYSQLLYLISLNLGYCEVSPSSSFDAGETIEWEGSELGDCNNFKFDPKDSEIKLYIQSKENDKFCPTSVKIVLDDGKDTTYYLDMSEGLYHNKGERDTKDYSANKLQLWNSMIFIPNTKMKHRSIIK